MRFLLPLLLMLGLAVDAADQKPLVINPTTGKTEQLQAGNFITLPNSAGTLIRIVVGTATPEGAVTAGVGSMFYRTDGGAATTLYVKESGAGNTGWVAVGGAAGITGTLASGRVPYANGVSTLTDSAKMVYSNTTGFNVNLASSGASNLTLGTGAGDSLTTGAQHTAIGGSALTAMTGGSDSVAVGFRSLLANTSSGVTAVGSEALAANVSGTGNTAVGFFALAASTANNNTAIGHQAGDALTTANNTAVGKDALGAASGADSTGVGFQALLVNTATQITAVGSTALDSNTSGTGNTAFGYAALTANVSSANNTVIGHQAGDALTTANNTAVGKDALGAASGADSTAVGFNSLVTSSVAENTAVGSGASDALTTSLRTVSVGFNALGTGTLGISDSTAIGHEALLVTTGANNTALGAGAGQLNTTGAANIFLGAESGDGTAVGSSNRLIVGSNLAPITGVYIGEGETNATPVAVTVGSTSATGLNISGSDLTLQAGAGTGTGAGGSLVLRTAPEGSSGAAPGTQTDALVIGRRGDNIVGRNSATFIGNVIYGVGSGNVAVSRQVGEELKSTVSGVAVAATGTVGNVTSVSLTAGDWLISGYFTVNGGATGLTAASSVNCSVVTTTATNGTLGDTMQQETVQVLTANGLFALCIPAKRVNISATTTYYLTEQVTFAAGSPVVSGTLTATRIR